ncbi:MAG: threonylcarbamoyl-AMP synthase [Actinobacteria bacterium]|nr:threonylcarbamoyl-AMP synthase [Actinomycetota bacterium]
MVEVPVGDHTEVVELAAAALRRGELVVLPTDTLYAVVADAFSRTGTRRLFEVKRRSRRFPLSVLVRSPKQLNGLVTTVPAAAERLMAAYWPGPLTMVVANDPNLMWDLGDNEGTVAVRMPLEQVTLDVIRAVGPLAVSTANLSGQTPAGDAATAQMQLGDGASVYLDAGARRLSQPSTIIDLTRAEPHVLRQGAVDGEQALAVARGELDPIAVDLGDPVSPPDGADEA